MAGMGGRCRRDAFLDARRHHASQRGRAGRGLDTQQRRPCRRQRQDARDLLPGHAARGQRPAVLLHAVPARVRARSRHRRGALAVRSRGDDAHGRGALSAQLPRRDLLGRQRGAGGRVLRQAHLLRHLGLGTGRARRRHRQALRRFRHGRPRRPAQGSRRAARLGRVSHVAAAGDARPRGDQRLRRRQPRGRCRAGRGARLRCAHGRARLGLEPGAAGLAAAAFGAQEPVAGRRAEQLVGDHRGSRARAGVRAHGQSVAGHVRRRAPRHRSLRQLHGRAVDRDRGGRVEFPGRAPRRVGLRHPERTDPVPGRWRRRRRAGRGADHQGRPRLPAGSRERRAAVPGGGAAGAAGWRSRRDALAHAAFPHASRAIAPECDGERGRARLHAARPPGLCAQDCAVSLGRCLHAADARGLDRLPAQLGRHELGQRGHRSRARAADREPEPHRAGGATDSA